MSTTELINITGRALRNMRSRKQLPFHLFEGLVIYQLNINDKNIGSPEKAVRAILDNALDALANQNQHLADIVRAYYWDQTHRDEICRTFSIATATLSRRQTEGCAALVTHIQQAEQAATTKLISDRLSDFPYPEFKETFGLKSIIEELTRELLPVRRNQILLLVGLGGIGKTTLAIELVRKLAFGTHFDHFLMVELPNDPLGHEHTGAELWELTLSHLVSHLDPSVDGLPELQVEKALRQKLNSRRYLVVVDNVLTTPVVTQLVENLRRITGNSHFIITSRSRPLSSTIVHTREVEQLNDADARAMLTYHLRDQRIIGEDESSEEIARTILPITRGHPQAILLIVSMLHSMGLNDIVESFKIGQGEPIDALYNDIYAQIWERLSENGRLILMCIYTMGTEGGTAQELQERTGLPNVTFFSTIQELTRAAIIEIRGDFNERIYGLHQLTLNFLDTKFG